MCLDFWFNHFSWHYSCFVLGISIQKLVSATPLNASSYFFYFFFIPSFLVLELQLFWTEIKMLNFDRILHPVSYFQLNSIF